MPGQLDEGKHVVGNRILKHQSNYFTASFLENTPRRQQFDRNTATERAKWKTSYLFMRLLAFWLALSMRDTLRTACGEGARPVSEELLDLFQIVPPDGSSNASS